MGCFDKNRLPDKKLLCTQSCSWLTQSNQLLSLLLVRNGIYEADDAADQQAAHTSNHTALSFIFLIQNNMY